MPPPLLHRSACAGTHRTDPDASLFALPAFHRHSGAIGNAKAQSGCALTIDPGMTVVVTSSDYSAGAACISACGT